MSDLRHSHSSIALYKSCPTKWKFSTLDGLVQINGGGRHDLDYGVAIHAGFETLYGEGGTVRLAQEAFLAAYPPDRYPAALPNWALGKTVNNGLNALRGYAIHWRNEDSNWEILEIEKLQDVAAEGENSRVVKLDLVIRDKRDGGIYGVDHKTTGKYLDKEYWPQFEPHSQIRGYTRYIKDKWGECAGFIINAVSLKHRSKAYTPRKGADRTPLPAGDWFSFGRMLYTPNENMLALEDANVAYWTDAIEQDVVSGKFGYNTAECHKGLFHCEYIDLCAPGYTWPRDEELISEWYYRQCREILNNGDRCRLPRGDHGDAHSTEAREQAPATDYVVEDDVVEEAVQ